MDLGCLSNFMRRGSRAKLSSCIRDPDKLVSITEITQLKKNKFRTVRLTRVAILNNLFKILQVETYSFTRIYDKDINEVKFLCSGLLNICTYFK
jgi:hypothetical protein